MVEIKCLDFYGLGHTKYTYTKHGKKNTQEDWRLY
jgi:hypothetical protein